MKAKKYPAAFLVFVMCFAMLPPCIATAENVTFTAIAGNQSNANEGYGNLFDGKKTAGNHSKWCTGTLPAYVVAKASSPVVVTGYTFTTGNDTASQSGRNPVSWTLSGCNDYDGSTKTAPEWNEIISETDNSSMPAENYKSVSFSCAGNTMSYQYYKLEITKVKNDSMLQLAELEFTYTFCEHDWEKTAETAASCTKPGSETLTCKKCSVQQTIQTPAAGHVSNGSSICPRCNKPLPVTVGESYYKDIQTAVNDAAANATVTLIGDVSINSTINISKDLTLDLNGFTVTQTGSGSVIEINGGKTFTLTDSGTGAPGAITGGKAARGGGVNMGKSCTFNLERAIISYCSATSEGGGVYVPSGSTFNMTNAVITHCEVPTNVGGGFSSFGTTTVTDSKIEYCSANYGGGIKIDGAGLTVSNSTVENCTTSKSGGGIFVDYGAEVIIKDNTVIRKNRASTFAGGGIFIRRYKSGSVTVTDSSVTENEAPDGGGIGLDSSTKLTLDNAKIIGNTASTEFGNGNLSGESNGGGIYAFYSTVAVTNNTRIESNTGGTNGGGIYATGGTVDINTDAVITKNNATSGGGIYASEGANINVGNDGGSSANILNNNATNGGGIYANNATVNLKSGNTRENKATNGGGIYAFTANVNLINGEVQGNTATESGGGVYAAYGSDVKLSGGTIEKNKAVNGAGAYMKAKNPYNNKLAAKNTYFTINENVQIINNTANNQGGGIYLYEGQTTLTVNGGYIQDNNAKDGGGIYSNYPTLNFRNGYIGNNNAAGNGGGIYHGSGTLNISGGIIAGNKANAGNGGGIFVNPAKYNAAKVTVSGGDICDNAASGNGGGIWMTKYTGKNNETTLEVNGGNIRDNKAKIGAGVYVNTGVNFSLYSAYITDNMAAEKAGGIYSGGSSITLGETPRVTGNRISSGEDVSEKQNIVKSNIYLPSGKKISIASGGLKPYVYDPDSEYSWVDNPEIYVTAENGAADITGSCADYSEYFFSDNESYAVKYADGVMKLVDAYKVTFEWGDGRPQTVISVPKDNASTVTLPDGEPWLEGYHFAGWLLDGKDYNFKKPVTADITLTPKWVKKGETAVSINYDSFYVFDLDRKATVYLAAYKNDALIDFWSSEADYDANYALTSIKTIEETGLNTSGADKIVVLLWGDNMQPVCSSAFITLP